MWCIHYLQLKKYSKPYNFLRPFIFFSTFPPWSSALVLYQDQRSFCQTTFGFIRCCNTRRSHRFFYRFLPEPLTLCATRVYGQVHGPAVGVRIPSLLAGDDHAGGEEVAGLQAQGAVLGERRAQVSGSPGDQSARAGGCGRYSEQGQVSASCFRTPRVKDSCSN